MDIPWSEVLAGSNDAISAAVTGGSSECGQEERSSVMSLPDHDLREAIERMKSQISTIGLKLPDKGAKFRARVRVLEQEQERRTRLVQAEEEEDKDIMCDGNIKCERAVSKDSGKSLCSPTSFQPILQSFTFTNLKLDPEADTGECSIASEKLLSAVQGDENSKQNELINSNSEKVSGTPVPLTSSNLRILANNGKRKSCSGGLKDIVCPSYPKINNVKLNSDPISKRLRTRKNYAAYESDWAKTLNVVLSDDEDVTHSQEKQNNDEMEEARLYYPSRDHPEFVEICYMDVKCLDPKSYLSSTIMNFYIQYLQNQASILGRPINEYHFFNTYFYQKLEKAVSCMVNKKANFSKLRRWLRGVNIFQKAYIFLPIHGDLHWSLVIICIPSKEDKYGPTILHLDSLGFHSSNAIFGNIAIYLKEEWEHVYTNTSPIDIPISKEIWDSLSRHIKKTKIMVPQQKNEYDCGLFVLYFMKRFIEEAPERVKRKDLAKFGNKWFQPEEASGLRKKLQILLLNELKNANLENHGQKLSEISASSQIDDVQQANL